MPRTSSSVIDSELQRAKTERDRMLAEVERDQNKIIQTKRADLETQLATAVTAQTQTRRESDAYKIDKVAIGEAARSAAHKARPSSSRASSMPSTRRRSRKSTRSAINRSSASWSASASA